MGRKEYDELTFTDDFMFWNILVTNQDLCKELLELLLDVKIEKICFPEGQKTIELKYDSRGIRLDVYVNDEMGTVYDLEMQTTLPNDLPKRIRYYQGMIDLNLIKRGALFSELKKSYIIFLCTGDPFEKRLPIYTFVNACVQDQSLCLKDEAVKVIVNPDSNRAGLSKEMNEFLDLLQGKKVKSGLAKQLYDAVETAKEHREWEVEYVTFNLKLKEEREEGRVEGRAEGLTEGRTKEIFVSVSEGDYSPSRGAEKLGISEEEFLKEMADAGYSVPN